MSSYNCDRCYVSSYNCTEIPKTSRTVSILNGLKQMRLKKNAI